VSRDTAHDIVLVDPGKCIACAMCAMVCPFDVITFHPMADGAAPHVAATKCDGCIERVRRDEVPACVEVCKVGALVFGELNELMAEGRAGETAKTLAAMALVGGPEEPDPIAGWRAWGTEAAQVAGSV
jgi:carbon-monoxide dehydrogenase iron sulfur subunit